MKNIILFLLFLFITSANSVFAARTVVKSITDVDTISNNTEFYVVIEKDVKVKPDITFSKGSLLYTEIDKIIPERYFRRNAYMVVRLITLNTDTEVIPLEQYGIEAKTINYKFITKKDLKKAGLNMGIKMVSTALPGSEQLFNISKGLLMPQNDKTRIESVRDNFIDSTPLRYFKKGKKLDINNGDRLILSFY